MTFTNSTSRFLAFSAAVGLATFFAGCGSKEAPKAQEQGAISQDAGVGGTGINACKSKTQCPAITMSKIAIGYDDTEMALLGYVGQEVGWEISGNDTTSSGRTVGILISGYPSGASVTPAPASGVTNSAQISWVPSDAGQSTSMMVVMRDLDRCKMMESNPANCNANSFLTAYDRKETIAWRIKTAVEATEGTGDDVVRVSNPNCGQNAATNGQIAGKLLQTGISVLTGGVAALPGILMQGVSGAVSGASANTQPTEC